MCRTKSLHSCCSLVSFLDLSTHPRDHTVGQPHLTHMASCYLWQALSIFSSDLQPPDWSSCHLSLSQFLYCTLHRLPDSFLKGWTDCVKFPLNNSSWLAAAYRVKPKLLSLARRVPSAMPGTTYLIVASATMNLPLVPCNGVPRALFSILWQSLAHALSSVTEVSRYTVTPAGDPCLMLSRVSASDAVTSTPPKPSAEAWMGK